jgi:hypothetical protein
MNNAKRWQQCAAVNVSSPGLYCPFNPCLWKVHSGYTAVMITAVTCHKDHLCNCKDEILFTFFLLVFYTTSLMHQSPVTFYFRREVLPCVVGRQLTQSARRLVSCPRSSRTGRPAALLAAVKIDVTCLSIYWSTLTECSSLFQVTCSTFFFHLFYTNMITGCVIIAHSTQGRGFRFLYWVILQ